MELLTTKQVSQRFNIPQPTLRGWRLERRGPRFYRMPGSSKVMYDAADVEAYVRAGLCQPEARACVEEKSVSL